MTTSAGGTSIRFHAPSYDERELEAVRAALAGHSQGDGPIGRRVEARLAELHRRRAARCSPPPAATRWSSRCWRSGIGPGQEVICPSFTFASTANAALRVGRAAGLRRDRGADARARPARTSSAALTPRTAALLPVHYAGVAPDMEALLDIAKRRGLRVVEDAAQGIAARWRGRALGTLGDAGCLSFHETKNLSCGEGGALAGLGPGAREARRDRAREGHEPRGLLPRRGRQVHLGRRGLELRAVGRAGRDPGRPARQARRGPGAARRASSPATAPGSRTGRPARACACRPSCPSASRTTTSSTCSTPSRRRRDAALRGAARARGDGDLPLRPAALRAAGPQARRATTSCPSPSASRRRCCGCRCTRAWPTQTSTA